MNRFSRVMPSATARYNSGGIYNSTTVIIAHASFTGFAAYCQTPGAVLTVSASMFANAADWAAITMVGAGTRFRYPATDQMNLVYNAAFLKFVIDTGQFQVFQKC